MKNFYQFITTLVFGIHPNNTIFLFNFHNLRHINKFLKTKASYLAEKLGDQNIIADIGGGKSPYYPLFQDIAATYIAVDFETSLPAGETRQIEQRYGTAEEVPIDDASLDIVMSNQVLEHVVDPIKTCMESYRVLKKGGYFIGSVPHISPVHLEPYDYRRYTDLGLKQLLEKTGFEVIEIDNNCGVHSTAAFMITMDWVLSKREEGKEQQFRSLRALILAPVVGLVNMLAWLMDKLTGNRNRSAANLCFIAIKR